MSESPHPPRSIKLQGSSRLWRIRVGDYRVVYEIFDDTTTVEIGYIRHRREIYRNL